MQINMIKIISYVNNLTILTRTWKKYRSVWIQTLNEQIYLMEPKLKYFKSDFYICLLFSFPRDGMNGECIHLKVF
jgi:hypothetical protein